MPAGLPKIRRKWSQIKILAIRARFFGPSIYVATLPPMLQSRKPKFAGDPQSFISYHRFFFFFCLWPKKIDRFFVTYIHPLRNFNRVLPVWETTLFFFFLHRPKQKYAPRHFTTFFWYHKKSKFKT